MRTFGLVGFFTFLFSFSASAALEQAAIWQACSGRSPNAVEHAVIQILHKVHFSYGQQPQYEAAKADVLAELTTLTARPETLTETVNFLARLYPHYRKDATARAAMWIPGYAFYFLSSRQGSAQYINPDIAGSVVDTLLRIVGDNEAIELIRREAASSVIGVVMGSLAAGNLPANSLRLKLDLFLATRRSEIPVDAMMSLSAARTLTLGAEDVTNGLVAAGVTMPREFRAAIEAMAAVHYAHGLRHAYFSETTPDYGFPFGQRVRNYTRARAALTNQIHQLYRKKGDHLESLQMFAGFNFQFVAADDGDMPPLLQRAAFFGGGYVVENAETGQPATDEEIRRATEFYRNHPEAQAEAERRLRRRRGDQP